MLATCLNESLAYGGTLATWWDPACAAVTSLAESFRRADADPAAYADIRFTVIAPATDIADDGSFKHLDRDSIQNRVRRYIDRYEGAMDWWYELWFQPVLESLALSLMSWEHVLETVRAADRDAGEQLAWFYSQCVEACKRH
jgi:hypothetical protein